MSLPKTFLIVEDTAQRDGEKIYNCKFSKVNVLRKGRSGAYLRFQLGQPVNSFGRANLSQVDILRIEVIIQGYGLELIEAMLVCGQGEGPPSVGMSQCLMIHCLPFMCLCVQISSYKDITSYWIRAQDLILS